MNATNFKGHLLVIADATNKDLSEALVRLWWEKYGALADNILLAAFGQVVDFCKFFPSPAEFNDILDGVKRAAGSGDPRAEDEAAMLMKKIGWYNPDLGIVNDGTRGLIVAGQRNRGEDGPGSGFSERERRVLRLFGGAARVCAWDAKDRQFNLPRLVQAFKDAAHDERVAAAYLAANGGDWAELPEPQVPERPPVLPPTPLRQIGGG